MSGRLEEALETIDKRISLLERNNELCCLPELLLLKGELLASVNELADAEVCFLKALELAKKQSTLVWELRAAMSLARMRSEYDRGEARLMLGEIYARFSEGLDTADLKAAKELMDDLDMSAIR